MVFLIEYNRPEGRIVSLIPFRDSDRQQAEKARLSMELDLHSRCLDHEVVLLEAEDEAALRQTHRRYFEDSSQIIGSTQTDLVDKSR